ncbi:ATP-dependent Clp protease adapter protein CLPS1, chloroplastic [Lactuca sativa]|uniref:ATP-dependent Clp protease adapter protein CLPS1, chloroplastic n=1 Tax=Lactuca sativa TaxID=4236 RepID=UPI0022AF1B04|nr:ATP-dependent Clp protease adapter protein CLPS1, chloroplastic [Lactuca sativa]
MAPPRLEKGVGVLDKPVIEKTTPGRESEFDLRKSRKMTPPYRVMLNNDNYNKREYVVQVLMKVIPGMTVDNAGNLLNIDWLIQLTRIGRDAVLYVESLIESIMGGLEGLINILDSEGGFSSLETHLLPEVT